MLSWVNKSALQPTEDAAKWLGISREAVAVIAHTEYLAFKEELDQLREIRSGFTDELEVYKVANFKFKDRIKSMCVELEHTRSNQKYLVAVAVILVFVSFIAAWWPRGI